MRNEVFISYSHKDGKYLEELRRFFAPFERELNITLWDDRGILPGSLWRTEIEDALKRARVAVLLVTANFLASRFIAESELPSILDDAERGGLRIVWIPLSKCAYEATVIAKYQAAYDTAKPLDLMTAPKRRAAWADIAGKVVERWKAQTSQLVPVHAIRSVQLAQVTDDLEEEAGQVLSYLSQYREEFAILPTAMYSQGGEAFRAAFDSDLARADLFVQLLGPRAGRAPHDLPEGYTRWQFERARAAAPRVRSMQWRHPDLDTNAVVDVAYRRVLTAESVVASGLEAFKRQILTWARKPVTKVAAERVSTVFINADERDLTIAKQVERECLAHALTAILPMAGPSSEVIRQDLAANLVECDVLVFIYGDTTQDWIRSQLRFFNKVRPKREAAPRLLAICSGPPPKPDIGISFPNARLINCPEQWNLQPIWQLIEEASV